AHVCDQHARVRMDPLTAPRRLYGREDETLSRMAARERLRGYRVDRRQLRVGEYRRLLSHAVRARIRLFREVRPRIHRPRGARENGARQATAAKESHVRMERRGSR